MYRTIVDFLKDWRLEKDITLKLFSRLSDESLVMKTSPEGRELGYIAWHIILSMDKMGEKTGIRAAGLDPNSDFPASSASLASEYEKIAEEIEEKIKFHLLDDDLLREIDVYGEKWMIGYALAALMRHNIHHKGQMTILMRQAGLQVPGSYGPSKEEWGKYNMQSPR